MMDKKELYKKVKVVPILYLDRGMWDTLCEINEVKL